MAMLNFFKNIFFLPRFYVLIAATVSLFCLSFAWPILFVWAQIALFTTCFFVLLDVLLLFSRPAINGNRLLPDKLSNGDFNTIRIQLNNKYPFAVNVKIIDELPIQFQSRHFLQTAQIESGKLHTLNYQLKPVERGEYRFGALHTYIASPVGLVQRRYTFGSEVMVPTYPSFLQMRQYELLAFSRRLSEAGLKKIRRIGHSLEFEQIKEYVSGDDYRTVNWKASARHNQLMVNQFDDEKSQPVYCLINMGRVMQMPFEGLSLLDYAINASLVMSNIAIRKGDKAGLLTFSHQIGSFAPAKKQGNQMYLLQELLYAQKTNFLEADYEKLYLNIRRRLSQRSLLLLFTNFETTTSLNRQLPYLQKLAKQHVLVVIFFENTELRQLLALKTNDIEDIYIKTIAEKFNFEKRLIVKQLQAHGIQTILTQPKSLTVNTINKYLELKARNLF